MSIVSQRVEPPEQPALQGARRLANRACKSPTQPATTAMPFNCPAPAGATGLG